MSEENINQELAAEDLKNVAGGTQPPDMSDPNTRKAVRAGVYRAGDEYLSKEERIENRRNNPEGDIEFDPNA